MAMDQHPVPQNVTNFQFRIVGDFTLKQVGYLAVGIIAGYTLYKSSLPVIFSWPLGIFSVIAGVGFAFIPIENRPMDVWVSSFFKRIYSPTLYSWLPPETDLKVLEKTNKLAIFPLFSYPRLLFARKGGNPALPSKPVLPSTLRLNLGMFQKQTTAPSLSSQSVPARSTAYSVTGLINPTNKQVATTNSNQKTDSPTPSPQIQQDNLHSVLPIPQKQDVQPASTHNVLGTPQSRPPTVSYDKTTQSTAPKEQPQTTTQQAPTQHPDENKKLKDTIIALQNQLSQTASEKNRLEAEKIALLRKLEQTKVVPQPVRQAGTAETTGAPTVRIMPSDTKKQSLKSLTSVPNVVTGIVKDEQGLLLPEIIVTIRDKEDVPLRALKTNKLGQFAASTPLQNNTYFIEIEDSRKRYVFDRIQITLNGTIVPLIEIRAKSQKQLERQKLADQIFGKTVQ